MNALKQLEQQGQAVWLDFLARGFVEKGELKKLVTQDGLRGVTSNPSIFEKAIASGDEYDGAIRARLAEDDASIGDLYEHLAIADIRNAADVLREVYDATHGADGFVSLEVSPYLANDTGATIAEARRLWGAVDRKNLMIKVPATDAGLPAVETLIGEGINVNITLLFARAVYEQVAEAYLKGLEVLAAKGGDVAASASVASFFVSRIDTAVDGQLDGKIAAANDPDEKKRLKALQGKVAIANAKLAYRSYQKLFSGPRWDALKNKGARPQRLLWASTGTKNKAYSDVLYVEELIGPDTVNTMPVATMDAFRDHGRPDETLTRDVDEAARVLDGLAHSGIALDTITRDLVAQGVQLFADAADKLYAALAEKRTRVLGGKLDAQAISVPPDLGNAIKAAAATWREAGFVRRLWQRDKSVWTGEDEDHWLGWLDCVEVGLRALQDYTEFAENVRRAGFTDALLLGMGGSSLGPEVLAVTFGQKLGFPKLRILDSTDPAQVRAAEQAVTLEKTLFIVSSKSGSTTEPNVLMDYFAHRLRERVGAGKVGSHFVAVTDPGSSLEKLAGEKGFRRVFLGDPAIGGRYSVLSPFGLVPAAAAGIDVGALLKASQTMVRSCGADVPPEANPAVELGLALGLAGKAGRDKVTVIASPAIADFGAWAEQLIAESTGKDGKGLIPVDGEPLAAPDRYGQDRFFVALRTPDDKAHEPLLAALEAAGHPVARITVASAGDIGQEFFRFEMAIAVAGAVLDINPFDQPDVEASKMKTRALTAAYEKTGALPAETPVAELEDVAIYTDAANATALRHAGADGTLESWIKAHLARIHAGDYAALLAYVAREPLYRDRLQALRTAVRDKRRVATCVGFGPRFLHSTGQAYKGGPNSGVFLQITADPAHDLAIPGQAASFGVIEAAQARGDFDVLIERKRRALRVHLRDPEAGLVKLEAAFRDALG
jgi:transaldolase / glucose-6-phosphate isomerase